MCIIRIRESFAFMIYDVKLIHEHVTHVFVRQERSVSYALSHLESFRDEPWI